MAVGVGGIGVFVGVAVGGTGVFVGVAVGGSEVFVGVAVGSSGVFVGVAVGGTGVLVGVATGVTVGGTGVLVAVGGRGVFVAVGAVPLTRPRLTLWSKGLFNPSNELKVKRYCRNCPAGVMILPMLVAAAAHALQFTPSAEVRVSAIRPVLAGCSVSQLMDCQV